MIKQVINYLKNNSIAEKDIIQEHYVDFFPVSNLSNSMFFRRLVILNHLTPVLK